MSDIWFLDQDGKSFTNLEEFAMRTPHGHLIVARGHINRIESAYLFRLRQLWEELLNEMENVYEMEELGNGPLVINHPAIVRRDALVDALAIMEYGWTYSKEPDNARKLVRKQAKYRYEMETE